MVIEIEPIFILILGYISMIVAYFSLVYFWVYPDSWAHGQNPKDWAVTGAIMMAVFQFFGFFLWIILYVHGRKKGPGYSYMNSKPIFNHPRYYQQPNRKP